MPADPHAANTGADAANTTEKQDARAGNANAHAPSGVSGARHPSSREAVFDARELHKTYKMGEVEVHALRGVNLQIYARELLVILGPSGSGKSTLLNILGGLDTATRGHVYYRGEELKAHDDRGLTRYRRKHVGFVFQFYNLIPSLTARENVMLVTEIADDPLDAAKALEIVELSHRLDHFPAQMSGGEQQRVAIARAIAKRPAVLLCDEPTGALDIATGKIVLKALGRVNDELGTTTAIITHNAAISKMAHRTVSMADGQVAEITENTEPVPADHIEW